MDLSVTGAIPGQPTPLRRGVRFQISPLTDSSIAIPICAVVSPSLLQHSPPANVNTSSWPHIQGLVLADPDFAVPGQIDLILGSDVYDHCIHGPQGTPMAYESKLGYVLMGPAGQTPNQACCLTAIRQEPDDASTELKTLLKRLWEIDEVHEPKIRSPEDEFCIQHFEETHAKTSTGRYIVQIPKKTEINDQLTGSRQRALQMLCRIEQKMDQDPSLAEKYKKFMADYIALGHMISAEGVMHREKAYFIPHHGVFKPRDPSNKLRVVLNASAKAPSGHNLNSLLHTGPNLQDELWKILIRWSLFRYVDANDIVKMYRQIQLFPNEWHLQTILFRFSKEDPIQEFVIPVLTYGLTSAQCLSIQVLYQLVKDEGEKYPLAADMIKKNRYIDDFCYGGDTIEGLERKK